MLRVEGILEATLYCPDLEAAERFYATVLGLRTLGRRHGRHVFFRCGDGVLLVFNPDHTGVTQTVVDGVPIPLHGARGQGHVAFRSSLEELDRWVAHLDTHGVAIEADVMWPGGGRSVYFRDPGGNSIEMATPEIWGI